MVNSNKRLAADATLKSLMGLLWTSGSAPQSFRLNDSAIELSEDQIVAQMALLEKPVACTAKVELGSLIVVCRRLQSEEEKGRYMLQVSQLRENRGFFGSLSNQLSHGSASLVMVRAGQFQFSVPLDVLLTATKEYVITLPLILTGDFCEAADQPGGEYCVQIMPPHPEGSARRHEIP